MRLTLLAIATALIVVGAADGSPASLSVAATKVAGEPVTIQQGIPVSGTRAETHVDEGIIVVRPRDIRLLSSRVFDVSKTPWVVALLAHEIGHVVRDTGQDVNEIRAACWARANVYRVAQALGHGPYRARTIAKFAKQDQLLTCF